MSFIEQHLVALFNFMLFVALGFVIMRKPVRVFLATRSQQFKLRMEAAGRRRMNAQTSLKHFEERLVKLGNEVAAVLKEMQEQGMRERDTIMERAQAQVRIMHLDAQRQITHGMVKLRQEMYRRAIEQAMNGAREELMRRCVGAESAHMLDGAISLITNEMAAGHADELGGMT